MIDHTTETVRPLTDTAARLPRRRGGKKVNVATLYRWSTRGIRGVRLETIQIGGTRCTSDEALQRFFERLSSADHDANTLKHQSINSTSVGRHHSDDRATLAELERLGL